MQFLQFKIFEKYKNVLRHGLSTRHGGVSGKDPAAKYLASLNLALPLKGDADEVGTLDDSLKNLEENYRRFCEALGVDKENILTGIQMHSDHIFCLKKNENDENFPGESFGWKKPLKNFDALITNVNNLSLMVRFADCQGVLMFDPVMKVIAAVHCGWRGNVQNIIGKAVQKMVENFGCDAGNILVGISQSLGPCCAEFSDPRRELPDWMQKHVVKNMANGKSNYVDLWQCSFDQLTDVGIRPENIEIMRRCTVCENDVFFSSRAGKGKMGLMGAIICLQ